VGCERPELLITETLAFHDRRTEDLNTDDNTDKTAPRDQMPGKITPSTPTSLDMDSDYDQRLVPQGSFFVELYNPWTTQTSSTNGTGYPAATEAPGEFYNAASGSPTGVVLNARVPDGTGKGSPVWRLLVVKSRARAG